MRKNAVAPFSIFKLLGDIEDLSSYVDMNSVNSFEDTPFEGNQILLKVFYENKPTKPSAIAVAEKILGNLGFEYSHEIESLAVKGLIILRCSLYPQSRVKSNYAITLGHGRHLLKSEFIDPDFGLRSAFYLINRERISSIVSTKHGRIGLNTKKQAVSGADFSEFSINRYSEIIGSMGGEIAYEKFEIKMEGSDRLAFRAAFSKDEFLDFLKLVTKAAGPVKFNPLLRKWATSLVPVDDTKSLHLENILAEKFCRDSQDLDFSWNSRHPISDLDFLIDEIDIKGSEGFKGKIKNVSSELSDFVSENETNGTPVNIANLFNSLWFKTPNNTRKFFVSQVVSTTIQNGGFEWVKVFGKWYQFEDSAVKEIEKRFEDIRKDSEEKLVSHNFPSRTTEEFEADYVSMLQKLNPTEYSVFDQKWVYLKGRSKIEICDLLTKSGILIHAKFESTSGISHLCRQAMISAEMLMDSSFRKKAKKSLGTKKPEVNWIKAIREDRNPKHLELTIVLLVIRKRVNGVLDIPLYGKSTIVDAVSRLNAMGYNALVAIVPDDVVSASITEAEEAADTTIDIYVEEDIVPRPAKKEAK